MPHARWLVVVCVLVATVGVVAPATAQVSFEPGPGDGLYASGADKPEGVALADVNGDGREDAIVGHRVGPGQVSVLLAQPDGSLVAAAGSPLSTGANLPVAVATGDFNGDSRVDVAAGHELGVNGSVAVFLGDGAGGFSAVPGSPFALTTPGTAQQGLAVADVTGDGNQDIVAAGGAKIVLLAGNGAGGFAAPVTSDVPAGNATANTLTVGDFSGDGLPDVITGDRTPPFSSVLFRNTGGALAALVQQPGTGNNVSSGDTNGDGRLDAIFTQMGPDVLTSWLVGGGGAFAPVTGSPFAPGVLFAAGTDLADLDADGDLDALVSSIDATSAIAFMAGSGAGGFAPFQGSPIEIGDNDPYVVAGDVNGDAQPDLVFTSQDTGEAGVLLNENVASVTVSGALDFGPTPVGQTSAGRAATLTTAGGGFGRVNGATIEGSAATDFKLLPSSCVGKPLAIGQACEIQVDFRPTVAGTRTAELRLATNAPGGTRTVALTGVGTVAPPSPPDATAPVVRGQRVSPRRFAVGKGRTPVRAAGKRRRVPRGTTIRFKLSEGATVKLALQRARPGRVRGRSCVKPTRKLARARKCTRFATVGTLTRSGKAGANGVRFSGRIGAKPFPRGAARVAITATDAAGNRTRRAVTAAFRVVKR